MFRQQVRLVATSLPQKVVENGLLDGHSGLEQHGEVSDLVRQLVAENRDGGRKSGHETLGEGGADREAVGEVVDPVAHDHHPSWNGSAHFFIK